MPDPDWDVSVPFSRTWIRPAEFAPESYEAGVDRQLVSAFADRTSGMLRIQARFYFAKNEGIFVLDVSELKMDDTSGDDRWTPDGRMTSLTWEDFRLQI